MPKTRLGTKDWQGSPDSISSIYAESTALGIFYLTRVLRQCTMAEFDRRVTYKKKAVIS